MAKQGFVMLHRTIQQHWIYDEKRTFSRYEAWLDLLMMVNYKDGKVLQDGELVEVKRGERITSIRQLMDRWGWSNTKAVKFLELLKSDNMIDYEITPKKKTLIKVVKYEQYQGFEEPPRNEKKTLAISSENKMVEKKDTKKTPENLSYQGVEGVDVLEKRHRKDTETTQNNINNKVNKENKKELKPLSQKFSTIDLDNANLLFELMLLNNSNAKKPNIEKWAETFRLIRERDKPKDSTVKYLIEWTQKDAFWKTNILSPTKLRQKWDQLYLRAKADFEKQQQSVSKPKNNFDALRERYKDDEQSANSEFNAASSDVFPKLEM